LFIFSAVFSSLKGKILALGMFQIDTEGKRNVYTVWLRFVAFTGISIIIFIVFAPTFLFSYSSRFLPWNEESRILPAGRTLSKPPSADQPKIDDVLHFRATPYLDDFLRGKLMFLISPDGYVKGIWNGEYDQAGDVHCIILAASFSGNIDPSKPCIEGNTHDASKLYFIAKGTFTLLENGPLQIGRPGVNGLIYVCGWLDPNYTATGELYLTEDKKSYEAFSWSAAPSG
jgi:hypothetical protein